MTNENIIKSALTGGLVAAISFSIPYLNFINCFCCIGVMAGGLAGLYHYRLLLKEPRFINKAEAVTIGIASGIFAAFIAVFVDWLLFVFWGNWELEMLRASMAELENLPELYESLDEMIYEVETIALEGFTASRLFSELIRNMIILPVFCLIGSLITRNFFNKKI